MLRVTRFYLACGALWLAACGGSSPSAPTPPPQSAVVTPSQLPTLPTGIWRGVLQIDCTTCYLPHLTEFVLRLSRSGDTYTGNIDIPNVLNVDLTGLLQSDGAVALSSVRTDSNGNVGADVSDIRIVADRAAGLTGTMSIRVHVPGRDAGMATILSAASVGPLVSQPPLEGHWTGRALITACRGYCPAYMAAGAEMALAVVLTNSNSTLSGFGTFGFGLCLRCEIPLTGTVSGASGDMKGELASFPSGSHDRLIRVVSFTATTDDVGQMRGHVRLQGESFAYVDAGNPANQWVSYDLEADLLYVLRQI